MVCLTRGAGIGRRNAGRRVLVGWRCVPGMWGGDRARWPDAEVWRLGTRGAADPEFPLLAIGIREVRSQNSWMHNSPTLMKGDRRQRTRINPSDAGAAGVVDGGRVRISSRQGRIETDVLITDEPTAQAIIERDQA